ncbi:MAG TPA: hypothetical protein VHX39_08835 [Acetobacteraceae bacterium]|nr:hypothetical protein [Acetobacteraceae bacterium]
MTLQMKRLNSLTKTSAVRSIAGAACLVSLIAWQPAHAQTGMAPSTTMRNVIPQAEEVTLQAKITAIDPSTRAVTLKGPAGNSLTVTAGPLVRLDLLRVGQTVNAQYYRSVAFIVNPPRGGNGVPISGAQFIQATMRPVQAPGGVALRMVKISGTVVGVDLSSNSISVVNPSGGQVYTIDVTDPSRIAMLPSLHVGDTISAVVTEVLAVSITPAPKGWF